MLDAARKQERESVRIDSPHQSPNAERGSIWRDELQSHRRAGPKPYLRSDLRTLRADIDGLTRMATLPRFDQHGPRDMRSRILSALSLPVAGFAGRRSHSIT